MALELRMPVADLVARLSWAEFCGWLEFFNWKAEQADRIRKGLPMTSGEEDDGDKINRTMEMLAARMKGMKG